MSLQLHKNGVLVSSKGMLSIPGLAVHLGQPIYYWSPFKSATQQIAGWGRKKSFFTAQRYAKQQQCQVLCLEDGFIRSFGLGKQGIPPFSVVVDYTGIYFDAHASSDLEQLILQQEDPMQNQRAERLIAKILHYGISKYNLKYKEVDPGQFVGSNILVVDQTYGDQSIPYAAANADTFHHMLQVAIHTHPNATIWIKTHPDVVAGKAKGHFDPKQFTQSSQLRFCSEAYHPYQFLAHFDEVYVVSSQLGFEALLAGKVVHCFGLPWYAGWGVTDDSHAPLARLQGRRQQSRSVRHLFVSAYVQYARYISPITQQRCELEQLIELLIPNIIAQQKLPNHVSAFKFSRWKKIFLTQFFNFPSMTLNFLSWSKPDKHLTLLAWGKKAQQLKQLGYRDIWCVEDGFVRSTGLGAELTRPYSLVFDRIGIYYDATQASELESILNRLQLTVAQQQRAERLQVLLIELAISKYNIGQTQPLVRPQTAGKVILVTGQVEDDVSVQLGGVEIKSNLALLQKVRDLNPDAYIIYKPHPDVQAGLRLGYIEPALVYQYANQIEQDASILQCFKIIDELHTISSLSGFEALLRGIAVQCYGLPFYAGWGLTQDTVSCARRTQTLTLSTLLYGVLIEYASYNLPQTTIFNLPRVNIEDVIHQLAHEIALGKTSPKLNSAFSKLRAKLLYRKRK